MPASNDPNIGPVNYNGNIVYESNFNNDLVTASTNGTTANCSYSSVDYNTKYSKFQSYIPTINTPIVTIKVAFHFFQKADGSNMWDNNAFTATQFNMALNWMNHRREFTDQPSSPIAGVPYIADARIRYEITGMYFYQNDALNASGSTATCRNAVAAEDPSRLKSYPIYFTKGSYSGASGYCDGDNIIIFYGNNTVPAGTIDHELGHAFGLYHTYAGSCCPETNNKLDPEYMSDIFDVSWSNYCNPPANSACYHTGNWNWDPYDNIAHPSSTNNLMGGCLYHGYVSPMQMGKMHRNLSLHNKVMWKYAKEMTSDSNYPLIVNTNETWDFGIQMYRDIVVKTGSTLTIKCKVGMANNGRIIVERGARLIVDGGEIYAWGTSWEGVQVWGTSNQRQVINANSLSTFHGIVNVKNQGILRDAINAIATTKNDADGNIDWGGYFGGIIQCDGAKFINNKKAVSFFSYHNFVNSTTKIANISYIRRSLFETNAKLRDVYNPFPESFISLWAVEGVKLYGNTYQNIMNPLPVIEQRGNGINSYDGSCFLDKYLTTQSKFLNLNYGLNATEASPFASITANNNDFISCNRSIYISGTHNTKITNNRIDIAQGENLLATQPYGIYSNVSTGYDISNNTITTSNATTNNNLATGVFFYSTGGLTNLMYRNTINKLNVGTTIVGNNRGNAAGEGLQFKCNQFGQTVPNYLDMWLHDDGNPWGNVGQIDAIQGNATNGANNRFSHSNTMPVSDFFNEGNPTSNYFYNTIANQSTKPLYYSTTLIPFINLGTYNDAQMCPVTPVTSGGSSAASALRIISNSNEAITTLQQKVDANNTTGLLTAINSDMSAGNLKNMLEQVGPYLSDQVLMAYFAKTSVPNGHIKDIHELNGPVTKPVYEVLLSRNLPKGILDQINNKQLANTASPRLALDAQIANVMQQKAIEVDTQVKNMLNDTVNGYNQDSIVMLLLADNRIRSKTRLLSYYVANEKLAEATNLLVDIKAQNNGQLDNFSRLQELIVSLKQTTEKIYTIKTDVQIKSEIELIANDKTNFAYAHAQALLSKVYGNKFYEYVALPSVNSGLRLKQQQTDESFEAVVKNMLLYPNPSNGNTNVNYLLPINFTNAEIVVYDIMGKQQLKQNINNTNNTVTLITQNLTSGMYFVNLIIDNKVTETQKLIMQ